MSLNSRRNLLDDRQTNGLLYKKEHEERTPLSDANPWMLPKITDYFDTQTDAVQKYLDKLEISHQVESDFTEIREAVSEHMRVLPLKWLLTVSYVVADDLYKTGNALRLWTQRHSQYIEASAGTFFQRFQEKGYVLRYGINNSFEQTDFGLQRPLYLLPALFAASGLVYVCPETVGVELMKHDGVPSSQFVKKYRQYEAESPHVARSLVQKCNEMRKSYVVLELGDKQDLLSEISADAETKVVTVFRSEPPIAGSNISVTLPKTVGLA